MNIVTVMKHEYSELMVMRVVAKAIALFFDTNTSSFARKIDYFNKIIIKSLCMSDFFCNFASKIV